MCPHIERIESAGPDGRARRIVFSDGSEPRLTSAAVIRQAGIAEGSDFTLSELETALAASESDLARERALRLLASRERSRHELDRRLELDGYPEAVRTGLLDRFVQVGLIDDVRFASGWARTRVLAGYGSRRIAFELAEKGVDASATAQALQDATEQTEVERARIVLRGQRPTTPKERDRLLRKLVSRGFDLQVALSAIDFEDEGAGERG